MDPEVGLRMLCLDGGGIRGLSELLILQAVMHEVQRLLHLKEVPRPADYFDMIGGTSTGGLIAIMLGRLRMTVDEAIDAYETLSRAIFGSKRSKFHDGKFSKATFESVIKSVVASQVGNENAKMREDEEPRCKSFVCTVSAKSVPNTRLFRSYRVSGINEYNCAIYEAARATCAAPTYFERVMIGPEGLEEEFFDGGLGSNNPIMELHREAELVFDGDSKVSCLLSIGTGARNPIEIKRSGLFGRAIPMDLIKGFKKMALSSEQRASEMDRKYARIKGLYFRLNVEHGLESIKLADWEQLGDVWTHTHTYLRSRGIPEEINAVAEALIGPSIRRDQDYTLAHLSNSNSIVIEAAQRAAKEIHVRSRVDAKGDPAEILRSWLSPKSTDASDAAHDLKARLAKQFRNETTKYRTGDWLFRESYWTRFIEQDNQAILWLQGPPGRGKSILTAGIIDKLQHLASDEGAMVLYHYCRRDPEPTSAMELVRSFLTQCLDVADTKTITSVLAISRGKPTFSNNDMETEDKLWNILQNVLKRNLGKIYLVVDGIDETRSNASPLRRILSLLSDSRSVNTTSLLLSSRFDCDIVDAIKRLGNVSFLKIDLTKDLVRQDLHEYVTFQINNTNLSLRRKPQTIRDDIIKQVCNQAEGSFLYATLVLDELHGEKVSSPAAISNTLRNLPAGVYDIYRHHLDKPRTSELGKEAFQWLCCARRPLSWDELRSALAIVDGEVSKEHLIDDDCDIFVQNSCGQLVEVSGEARDKIGFIHSTVKEMLVNKDGPAACLGIEEADSLIALKLLTFLENENLPGFSSDLSFEENHGLISQFSKEPGFGLYPYAVCNWFVHIRNCGTSLVTELEEQLCSFLSSSACVSWLKSALFISTSSGYDSTALTADVVEGLEAWLQTRALSGSSEATQLVNSWISDFLDLMRDWGRALEYSPFWIHCIPQQFLGDESGFKQAQELGSEQSVIQLREKPFFTNRFDPFLWQHNCFAMDVEKNLAYTWDQASGFVSCYHTGTGLLAAEMKLNVEPEDPATLRLVRGTKCPSSRYVALMFQVDSDRTEIYQNMRMGLQITVRLREDVLSWVLQNELCMDEYSILPGLMGARDTRFLICVLELNYDGLMRTNLFGHPKWSSGHVCMAYEQWPRWELDDVDVLAFSADSSELATPTGFLSMETGKTETPWSYGSNGSIWGGKMSKDFSTFAIVRKWKTVELLDPRSNHTRDHHHFPGIVHILCISEHGRYLLLLLAQTHPLQSDSNEDSKTGLKAGFVQDGFIGIFDWRKKHWTPLLEVGPPVSRSLSSWDFGQRIVAKFSPESSRISEIDQVVVQSPLGWKLSENVRCDPNTLSGRVQETCFVVFHSEKLRDGFGYHPTLMSLSLTASLPSSVPLAFRADFMLGSWKHHWDLHPSREKDATVSTSTYARNPTSFRAQAREARERITTIADKDVRVLLRSGTSGDVYQIEIAAQRADGVSESTRPRSHSWSTDHYSTAYQLHVTCLKCDDQRPSFRKLSVQVNTSESILPVPKQNLAVNKQKVTMGTVPIDTPWQGSEADALSLGLRKDIFSEICQSFQTALQPFQSSSPTAFISKAGTPCLKIFSGQAIALYEFRRKAKDISPLSKADTEVFIASNITTVADGKCFVQFSRAMEGVASDQHTREANQFEVFLCVFDQQLSSISWMVHTTTAGSLKQSIDGFPEAFWTLHPKLPLLFWTLPGHVLRVSCLESNCSPINVAHPLTIEGQASELIRFSPSGRFMTISALPMFKNDFLASFSTHLQITNYLTILDLMLGTSTQLQLSAGTNLSFELDDEQVKIYQLTRLGAIQMDRFFLPDLDTFDRHIISFVPGGCCCATCCKPLEDSCYISVTERQGVKLIALGHSPFAIDRSSATENVCEPILFSIASPEIPVKVFETIDSLVETRKVASFPPVMNTAGELLPDAFTSQGNLTLRETLNARNQAMTESEKARDIPQMQRRSPELNVISGQNMEVANLRASWYEDYLGALRDLAFEDGFQQSFRQEEKLAELSAEYGDIFPPTWADFQEMLTAIEDTNDPTWDKWMKILFADHGIGCNIPLYTHTFYYGSSTTPDSADFTWSSAVDIGWIEESSEWFYRRFFKNDFTDARMWYHFSAYADLSVLKWSKTQRAARRARRKLKRIERAAQNHPGSIVLDLPSKGKRGQQTDAEQDDEDLEKLLQLRDFMEDLEDVAPGAGKLFRDRMSQFLNQSLLGDDE